MWCLYRARAILREHEGYIYRHGVDAYENTYRGVKSKLAVDLQSDDAPGVGIRNGGDMAWCLTERRYDWATHKCLPISFLSEKTREVCIKLL